LDASQSNDLICKVSLFFEAAPQIPATVHAALIIYGTIFNLYIDFLLIFAPFAIPYISYRYRLCVYFFVISTFKSRRPNANYLNPFVN
jgi:hypothetical protein